MEKTDNRTCRGLTVTEELILTALIKKLCLGDVARVFDLMVGTVDIHRIADIWDGNYITCIACGKEAILFNENVKVITENVYSREGNPRQLTFQKVQLYKCHFCQTVNIVQF